jgi:hypothetical protein
VKMVNVGDIGELVGKWFVVKVYAYTKDRTSKMDPSLQFYICQKWDLCKGRIHMRDNVVVKIVNKHTNHLADVAAIEAHRAVTQMKEVAGSSQEVTSHILQQALGPLSQPAAGVLPKVSTV